MMGAPRRLKHDWGDYNDWTDHCGVMFVVTFDVKRFGF